MADDLTADSQIRIIAKGALIFFLGSVISKLLGVIYRIIVARAGTEIYGLILLGAAVYGIFLILPLLGLNEGIVNFVSYYLGKKDESRARGIINAALLISTPLAILFSIILFSSSSFISIKFFHNPQLSPVLKVLAIAIPFDVIRRNLSGIARAYKKVQYEVYARNIGENIFKVIFTSAALSLGLGLFGVATSYTLAMFCSFLIAFYLIQKKVFPILPFKNNQATFQNKELLKYSIPLLFTTIINLSFSWTDTIILGYFRPASEVGIYNAASPIAQMTYFFPNTFLALFLPILVNLHAKKNPQEFSSVYKTITKWIFLINVIILAVAISLPKQIIHVLFGTAYLEAALSLVILIIGYFIYHLSLTSENIIMVFKKTNAVFFIFAIGSILNIILNIILIPTYGITGAAAATTASFIIMSLLTIFYSLKLSKIFPYKLNYIKIIISILISAYLTRIITPLIKIDNIVSNLIVSTMLILLFYSLLILFTKTLEKDDVMIIGLGLSKIGIKFAFIKKLLERFS